MRTTVGGPTEKQPRSASLRGKLLHDDDLRRGAAGGFRQVAANDHEPPVGGEVVRSGSSQRLRIGNSNSTCGRPPTSVVPTYTGTANIWRVQAAEETAPGRRATKGETIFTITGG